MANAQLVTYIKQQMQLGESEAPIKSSLKSVGWSDSDITEAFKAVNPSPAAASPAPAINPVSPSPASPSFPRSAPTVEPKKINLGNFAPVTPSISRPTASPATISFSAQKPVENVFNPKGSPSVNGGTTTFSMPAQTESKKGSIITTILMGLVIVALAALTGLLYKNNTELKAKVSEFTNQVSALTGKINTSGSGNAELAQQISRLEEDLKDLDSQLALFLPLKVTTSTNPTASSTSSSTPTVISTPVPLTLKGALGGGGKVNYTLTTSKNILVNIKNSKDAKVDAMLKPLVGSPIELTGTPTSGAREITVTHINGAPIQ